MAKINRSQIAEKGLFDDIGGSAIDNKGKVELLHHALEMLSKLAKDIKGKLSIADPKDIESINEINTLTAKANTLTADRTTLNKELSSTQAKVNSENSKSIKGIEKLTADLDSLRKQRSALNRAEKKGIISAKDANKERTKLNLEIRKSSKELNEATKRQLGLISAIDEEKKKLTRLIKAREGLSLAGRDNSKTSARLEKQIRQTAKGIEKAEQSTRKFKKGFTSLTTSVDNVRKRLGQLMTTLGIIGGFQLLRRVVGGAVDVIRDFEKANAELAGVLNTNLDGISKLTKNAKDLGAVTAFTASQVTALQLAYSRLGFTQEEIIQLTEGTINGAIALNAGLDETAELAGAIVRTFSDLDTSDTSLILDKLTVSTQKSALNFQKLQKALPIVGGAAEAAGVDFNRLLALLGKLSDSGIDASTSATALRNIFIESSAQGLSYEQILAKIVKEQDKLTASTDEFGKRAAVSANILADNLDATVDLEKAIANAGGTAEEVAKTQLDTLDGSIKLLQSAWEGWILRMNDSIDAAGFLKNAIRFLANNLDTILSVVGKITKVFLAFKGTVILVNLAMKAQSGITKLLALSKAALSKGLKGATVEMKKFNAAQRANIIGAVVAAVVLLIDAFDDLAFSTSAAEDAEARFNEELSRAQGESDNLFESLKNVNKGTDEHRRLIEEVNSKYGAYLDNLITEESSLTDIEKAQNLVNKALERNIAIKVKEESKAESTAEAIKAQKDFGTALKNQLKGEGKDRAEINEILKEANELIQKRAELNVKAGRFVSDQSIVSGLDQGVDKDLLAEFLEVDKQIRSLEKRANVGSFGFLGKTLAGELGDAVDALTESKNELNDIDDVFDSILGDSEDLTPSIENSSGAIENIVAKTEDAKTRLEQLKKQFKDNRDEVEALADENTKSDDKRIVSLNTEGRLLKDQIKIIEELLSLDLKAKKERTNADRERIEVINAELDAQRKLIAFNPNDRSDSANDPNAVFIDEAQIERDLQIKKREIRLKYIQLELKDKENALNQEFDSEGKLFEDVQKLRLEDAKLRNQIRTIQFQETQEELLKEEQDLLVEFRNKKIAGELDTNEKLVAAEEQLQKDLLDIKIEAKRNEKFLADEGSLEFKRLEAEILELQLKKENIGVDRTEKEQAEKEAEIFELRSQTIIFFTDLFVAQADRRIAKLEEEITAAQRQADILAGLAQSGNINASESLKQQDQIIAEANLRKERLERRKQRVLLASSVLQAYNTELSNGSSSTEAFAKAITSTTVLSQFIAALPTFFDGIESTGKNGRGIDGRGGFLSVLHPDERVVPKIYNDVIGADISNEDLASIVEGYRSNRFSMDLQRIAVVKESPPSMKKELLDIKQAIIDKPELDISLGEVTQAQMKIIERRKVGNVVTTNVFKVE